MIARDDSRTAKASTVDVVVKNGNLPGVQGPVSDAVESLTQAEGQMTSPSAGKFKPGWQVRSCPHELWPTHLTRLDNVLAGKIATKAGDSTHKIPPGFPVALAGHP